MRAGLFGPDEIAHLPVVREAMAEARLASLDEHPMRLRHETIRRVIDRFVTDLVAETRRRIAARDPKDADAIRRARQPVVGFSPAMAEANHAIREFLYARMYRHWRVARMARKAKRLTAELFEVLDGEPGLLPDAWRGLAASDGKRRTALTVCDYIAGMTDRFAIDEHRRLTDLNVPG